jgi:RimJ/RimL family protein N-acetyltransferase
MLDDPAIVAKTIVVGGQVAGHVARFEMFGKPHVAYWVGREYWGTGVATRALAAFLETVTDRPLYARVASDNRASLRVLEKCGFAITGRDTGYAHARGEEVEEFLLMLPPA